MEVMYCSMAVSRAAVGDLPALLEVRDGLDGKVRVDGAGAETHERGEVHDLPRLRGLHDEGGEVALLHPREVVVERRGGEERGDGRPLHAHLPVGEDQHGVAGVDPRLRLRAERGEGLLQALSPSAAAKVMGMTQERYPFPSSVRSLAMSSLDRTGCGSFTWRQCSGVSSRRFFSLPRSSSAT